MRSLAILHPFPSAVNAALVGAIALIAGGTASRATILAGAMLAVQFSIGVTNDLVDLTDDRGSRPTKPLVRGDLTPTKAMILAAALGAGGLALAGSVGLSELVLLGAMYGIGVAYSIRLKRLGLGWAAYAAAFPLLPAYAWAGATGALPPRYPLVVLIAALAGPTLALANGLVDHDRDRLAGVRTTVVRIGHQAAWWLMAMGVVIVHAAAAAAILPVGPGVLIVMASAAALAAAGVTLSRSVASLRRERGWRMQAMSVALLAVAWLAAAAR